LHVCSYRNLQSTTPIPSLTISPRGVTQPQNNRALITFCFLAFFLVAAPAICFSSLTVSSASSSARASLPHLRKVRPAGADGGGDVPDVPGVPELEALVGVVRFSDNAGRLNKPTPVVDLEALVDTVRFPDSMGRTGANTATPVVDLEGCRSAVAAQTKGPQEWDPLDLLPASQELGNAAARRSAIS
jgi:hypothetical protein